VKSGHLTLSREAASRQRSAEKRLSLQSPARSEPEGTGGEGPSEVKGESPLLSPDSLRIKPHRFYKMKTLLKQTVDLLHSSPGESRPVPSLPDVASGSGAMTPEKEDESGQNESILVDCGAMPLDTTSESKCVKLYNICSQLFANLDDELADLYS